MKRITRRKAVAAVALALPAALLAALLRPRKQEAGSDVPGTAGSAGIQEMPAQEAPPDGPASRVVRSGTVVAIRGDEITIVNSGGEQVRLLRSEYEVDDGFWVNTLPIERGDHVITSAGRLYVNPKFLYGSVLDVIEGGPTPPIRFRMRDRYDLSPYHEQQPEGHVIWIDPRTWIVGPLPDPQPTTTPYELPQDLASDRRLELEPGQFVEVSGREHRGMVYAIRLTL